MSYQKRCPDTSVGIPIKKFSSGRNIKTLTYVALASMMLGTLFLAVGDTSAETHTQDKACFNTNPNTWQTLQRNGDDYYQPFTPTQNRLDQVVVKLGSNPNNDGGSGTMVMQIRDGEEILLQKSMDYTNLKSSSPQYFYFNNWNQGDVAEITPGHTYNIRLTSNQTDSQNWLYWYTTTNCDNDNNFAYREEAETGYYLNFSTWGWTVDESGDEEEDSGQTEEESTLDQTSNSDTTDAETLGKSDASIAKPTNLEARYEELNNKRGAKLTFEASDTDNIDGYKIFKSEDENKNYLKIAQTKKDILEYLDENIKASTTYYYIVRAYQNSSQSYNSNIAEVTTPEDVGPNKPQSLRILDFGQDFIEVAWTKNTEEDLAGYIVMITENSNLIDSAELSREDQMYKFENLNPGTVYTITLVAKNNNDKLSPSASIVQMTSESAGSSYILTTAVILLGLGGVGLLLLLILLILKRRREEKTAC